MVFSATVFPPVLGPLMIELPVIAIQLDTQRNYRHAPGLEGALQQRMTGVAQHQRIANLAVLPVAAGCLRLCRRIPVKPQQLHRHAVVVLGEARFGELQLELCQDLDRCRQRLGKLANLPGHLQQDAVYFGLLFVVQTHQLVVLLNRFQRLDEHCLAAGRRSVRHSLHSPALLDFYGNDKALAANRDQLFLDRAPFRQPPQIRAQRLLDRPLLLFDLPTNAGQLGRSPVIQRAVGQDLVAEIAQQRREVC